ncbi:MAG: cupin domain-containing protein [Pseudomonadota bacterium]|nr:cupin domain-containing protein [Pseudomonadota bacterium]|tara:strand:+ start:532 stop:1050 length:519 start_codon:yes stop_codon:yes gene_type:complete
MKSKTFTPEQMNERLARFDDLKPTQKAFVDSLIPGMERDVFTVIGSGVTEDINLSPAIKAVEGFNVTYIGANAEKGASLHSHDTVEVFFAMSGNWEILWGDEEENRIELNAFDIVSVPAGVMRSFRNIGKEYALMMTIVGGTDAGHVIWPAKVLDQARKTGLDLDDEGNLLK